MNLFFLIFGEDSIYNGFYGFIGWVEYVSVVSGTSSVGGTSL